MAENELIKNVVFRARVEAEPSPGAKETADTIRTIADEEKKGLQTADAFTAAQQRATDSAQKNGAAYTAVAQKMGTMFTVIKDGTKNVLAYVALDGQVRKVEASFKTGADGGIRLAQTLNDIGNKATDAGGDLDALKQKAADLKAPPPGPIASPATPVAAQPAGAAPQVAATVQASILALEGLSEEAKQLAIELLKMADQGTQGLEEMDAAAKREVATFRELLELAKQTPQGQEALKRSLTDTEQAAIETLVAHKAIKEEQRAEVEQAVKMIAHQREIEAQAKQTAATFEQQLGVLSQLAGRVEQLKQKSVTTANPEELARTNEELKEAKAAYDALATSTVAAFNTAPIEKAVGLLGQYASVVEQLKQRRVSVSDPEELARVNALLAEAQKGYNALAAASASAASTVTAGLTEQISVLEQYASRVQLLEQKRVNVGDPAEIERVNSELAEAKAKYDAVALAAGKANDPTKPRIVVQTYTSLRTQLQEAKARLDQLVEANTNAAGKLTITKELTAAAIAAGRLQERFKDVNDTVDAFNPDKRFQTLTGLLQNALGGFTALQGAIGLVGGESEEMGKALLKVQSALAITQGLQALFGGLRDNLRNLRLLVLSTAAGQRILAAASIEAGAAAATQGTLTAGLSRALRVAKVAAVELWAVLVANPIGIIVAAIGVLVFTIYKIATANEVALVSADRLTEALERVARARQLDRDRSKNEATLENEGRALQQILELERQRAAIPSTFTQEQKDLANLRIDEQIAEVQRKTERQQALRDAGTLGDAIRADQEERLEIERAIAAAFAKGGEEFIITQGRMGKAALDASHARLDMTEAEARAALSRAIVNDELSEDEIADLDKLEAKRDELLEKERKNRDEINAIRLKAKNKELQDQVDITKALERQQDIRSKVPLAGSIAAFQRELERLKKIAQEIPQDAFTGDVMESIRTAIAKAEADLKRAQDTFVDNSAERLAERQRQALAIADLDAREAADRLRSEGATAEEIAQAEATANDKRLRILQEFEEERLGQMIDSGKATVAEIQAQQNKIAEIERTRGITGGEGETGVSAARRADQLAELDERRRHTLAIAELDEQAALTRATNERKSEAEIQQIQTEANRQRLLLEIDFELERLKILQAAGSTSQAELQAQINKINELRAELQLPGADTNAAQLRVLVQNIVSAADQIAQAGIQAWRAWSDAAAASIERQLELQRQRVERAKEISDKGNAAVLEDEKKRMDELLDARRRAAERNSAIAQIEAVANAAVAITRAAAEGGGWLSAVTIAATLIALTAGLVQARQLASSAVPSFRRGGAADWSDMGGYTGEGHPDAESRHLGAKPYRYHRKEFIMDAETTAVGRNKWWFEKIHTGRINVDHLINPRGFVKIDANTGLNDKQVNRIVEAVQQQPGTEVISHVDQDGLTIMVKGRLRRAQLLRNR